MVFTKYELRHFFLQFLKTRDYKNNYFFKTNLSTALSAEFPKWEWFLYTNPAFNKVAIGYIYLTKMRWRSRGYPRLNY